MKTLVPPIKCQGIKTKLIPLIKESVPTTINGRWIEPFCGSCVVALNVRPERALLTDTNAHIISLYQQIQSGAITPEIVRRFLEREGEILARRGEEYYYEVRARFNEAHNALDFLFLNRSCFNGVMRFNRKGAFNVPFCRKPTRFSQSYITKIVNQVKKFRDAMHGRAWQFEVLDFRHSLAGAETGDFVYVDPPYEGRHTDYFNSWSVHDQDNLVYLLKQLPCNFLMSTWQGNEYRENMTIQENWQVPGFFTRTHAHFYHVGATEELRNGMTEALIANYDFFELNQAHVEVPHVHIYQQTLLF